jgi:hypothetical protein
MGISYDPTSRKWSKIEYEDANLPLLPTETTQTIYVDTQAHFGIGKEVIANISYTPRKWYDPVVINSTSTPESILSQTNAVAWALDPYAPIDIRTGVNYTTKYATRSRPIGPGVRYSNWVTPKIEDVRKIDKLYAEENKKTTALNVANQAKNDAYDKTLEIANATRGDDYVAQRESIRNLPGLDETTKSRLETYYKAFYQTEKLKPWYLNDDEEKKEKENKLPNYENFVPSEYEIASKERAGATGSSTPSAGEEWDKAVKNDDIDIIGRYANKENFYRWHYISIGRPAGVRGNKADATAAANEYLEKPTDVDIQDARTFQLGVNTDTQTERLLKIPAIASEWEKAKRDDPYWKEQAKEKFLDVNKPDEFAALFRLSDRPEDQIVRLNYNANAGYGITELEDAIGEYGITELEDAIGEAVGEKATVDVKRFGALTQDVLKQTIAEMKKAKAREQEISMFKGFGAFGEIVDINKELSNSILGDSGVGGILSFTGGGKAQESLEKSLTGITGVNTNNTVYNWQKWFDETLKTKYDENLELGYTTDEAKEQVKIEADFAKEFVDKYLTPRFNQSKSMDEFVEYLDVRQSEQNPFQTQDILDAAKGVAKLRADKYLQDVEGEAGKGRRFNVDFYFNPTGNKARESRYSEQAATVAADWETAKNNPNALIDPTRPSLGTWAQQAYRFGIKDLGDKEQFARVHYQLIGSLPEDPTDLSKGTKFDPADDILNASKVSDYIYTQILPALKEEALKSGTVFGQFITPEEFADEMLRGLDPNDKSTWDEVLKRYGLENFKGSIEELKDYVKETLRTGSAQEIRENIKYLNEKRQKPTQEALGVTYIERPEDYKDEGIKGETELYRTFQSAGFKGTEDEFYKDFFPDTDRSEQALLTKSGKDESLKTTGLDFTDPFASLGTIESFFDADKPEKTTDKPEPKTNSYFRIAMGEDEDEPLTKSKSGSSILGEFTSMFKGL